MLTRTKLHSYIIINIVNETIDCGIISVCMYK